MNPVQSAVSCCTAMAVLLSRAPLPSVPVQHDSHEQPVTRVGMEGLIFALGMEGLIFALGMEGLIFAQGIFARGMKVSGGGNICTRVFLWSCCMPL